MSLHMPASDCESEAVATRPAKAKAAMVVFAMKQYINCYSGFSFATEYLISCLLLGAKMLLKWIERQVCEKEYEK